MTDYTMTKGMSDWMAKYNQFTNEQAVEVSAWSNAGITYINGFSQHSEDLPNSLKYRTIKRGGTLIRTEFAGFINTPATKSSQGVVEFCKIPSSLIKGGFTLTSNKVDYIATGQYVLYGYNTVDSALTMNLFGLTKDLGAGALQTNVCFSW